MSKNFSLIKGFVENNGLEPMNLPDKYRDALAPIG